MVRLRFETDFGTTLKAHADLAAATEKIAAGYQRGTVEAKKLEMAAARIIQQNETPQERYNRKIQELGKALRAGAVGFDDAQNAAARLRHRMEDTFGGNAANEIKSYLSQFVGPTAILGLATLGVRNFRGEIERLRELQKTAFTGPGQLAQLAITERDPQQAFQAMLRESRRFQEFGVGQTPDEAANLVFALRSAKFGAADREFVARAKATGLITDVEPFVASINAIRKSFPGISPQQVFSMALVAAGPSPGTASGLTAVAGRSGAALRQLQFTPGFGLAATGILSEIYGQAEAGTRMEQFLKQFEKYGLKARPDLRGRTGPEVIREIGRGGLERGNLERFVGDRLEAMQAIRSLYNNLDQLQELTTATEAAARSQIAQKALALPTTDPELAAGLAGRSAAARRQRGLAPQATAENVLEAIYNDIAARRRQRQPGLATELLNARDVLGQFFTLYNLPGAPRAEVQRLSRQYGDFLSPETKQAIDVLQSIDRKIQPTSPPKPSGRQE